MTTMTGEIEGAVILKTDRLGRVRTSAARRAAILEEFDRSGATAAAFAQIHGIKYQTFASWIQKRSRAGRDRQLTRTPRREAGSAIQFAEVIMSGTPEPDAALEVELPGGAKIRVTKRAQCALAVNLIRELQQTGSGVC
mgnify:FL=1|jgi:transposase-like protein